MSHQGFTLAELLLAIGLLVILLITVALMTILGLRSNQKSLNHDQALQVAEKQLERVLETARLDQPPGTRAGFWGSDSPLTPYERDVTRLGNTDYTYAIYTQTVQDLTTGSALGGADNRVKKVDVVVWWYDSDQSSRQGYGRLSVRASRLTNEFQ